MEEKLRWKQVNCKGNFTEGKVSSFIISQALPLTVAQQGQIVNNVVDRICIDHKLGQAEGAAFLQDTMFVMARTGMTGFIRSQGIPRYGPNLLFLFCVGSGHLRHRRLRLGHDDPKFGQSNDQATDHGIIRESKPFSPLCI